MHLAPDVPYTVQRLNIGDGMAGTLDTIAIMRKLVREASRDPAIREAAARLIWNQPARSHAHEVAAIFEWVRDSVRYIADPLWFESVGDPRQTLQLRRGDCDDKATLLAALLESVGYATRFVVTGYVAPEPEHVYLEALISGQWLALDPTEHGGVGYAPPGAIFMWTERV